MASHFFLLLSSLIAAIAIIPVLYSINISVLLTTPLVASQLEKSPSFWTTGADMPTPRTDFTAAALNGSIYIIGGFDSQGTTKDTVEFYNPKTDKWNTASPLPDALDHAAAAALNNKLYVVGGYDDNRNPTDKLFIYDPLTDKWQEGNSMPTNNFVNGILYAVGGVNELGVSDSNFAVGK